ncbi:MAG: hypothetical protein O6952_09955, partial [Planctomycetota bacterium]|nr:hypothetical protein [Planctomycetota bacterium]
HAIRLSGSFLGEQKEFVFEGTFAKEAKRPAIPRLWALRKVGYLLDQIRLNGVSKEVKDEIVRLAKKYGIITPYTSYLVMEEGEVTGLHPLPAPRRALRRHFGGLRDTGAERTAGKRVARAPRAMGISKGRGSQDLSGTIQKFRERINLGRLEQDDFEKSSRIDEVIRKVGEKTFYKDGALWVDSASPSEEEAKRITYLSDAYFALLREKPGVAPYLAIGARVRVYHAGTLYEIVE